MRKCLILGSLILCFVSTVSQAGSNLKSLDQLQQALYGASTLKGVKEVAPQVQIEILKQGATQLSSTSKIESLTRKDLQSQITQALKKADIKIAENIDFASPDSPLGLHVTVFIKVANTTSPTYNTYINTEAVQSITLSRDNAIRSFSRTWPMIPRGLHNRNMFVLNSQTLEKQVKDEVNKQVDFFISDFLAANPKTVSRSAEGVDIAALRKTLIEENPEPRYGLRIKDNDTGLQAIQKLEAAGSQEAVNVLLEFLTNNRMDRKLKQHALTALGKIGTEQAVEAVKKFESWSQKRYTEPQIFQMGTQEHAIDHFASSTVQPLAQTTDQENKTWALVPLNRYGQVDLFLTSLIENDHWSEPICLNVPGFPQLRRLSETRWNVQCQLQVDGDSVRIENDNKTYESRISDQLKDTDKDGLPDNIEARFLTDLNDPDSDGDGISDGKDSNPLTPKQKETNDTTEIRQAVFSVLFATTSSQGTVVIVDRDDFAKQEYYGFAGAVLRAPESKQGFVNVTSIDIRYQSETDATANISDWEGSLAASVHEAKLKKINGKWVVIEFRMTMIS